MKSLLNQRYPSHTLTLQVPQLTTEGFPSLSRGCVAPENLADQRKELFGSHLVTCPSFENRYSFSTKKGTQIEW